MKPKATLNAMKKFSRRALIVCAGLSLLGACTSRLLDPNAPISSSEKGQQEQNLRPLQKKTSVKVTLLLPLTAGNPSTASVAKSLKQAGELALFDFDNPNILLTTKDTKGTPEGAKAATEAAVKDGAELIIGPLFATSVQASSPVAREAGIPMIAFSSDQKVAGDGVYLLSFLAGKDLPRIISHAVSQGKTTFAALIPKTPYGEIVELNLREAVTRAGGEIVALERFPLDANGMLAPVKKISEVIKREDEPVQALLLPGGPETLPTLAPLMPYFEIDPKKVKFIGTGLWDYANVGREKPLIGGWFPAPDPSGWRNFTQKYAKTYGKAPPRIASLSYDAVSLAVSLSTNPQGQRYSATQLTRDSGFAGIDGLFRLKADGTSERGLAVLEVKKFGSSVISPAPSVFGQAQF
ncbi:MAG: penicillin-binding protein activator [Methyloligellaceae bacterium]